MAIGNLRRKFTENPPKKQKETFEKKLKKTIIGEIKAHNTSGGIDYQ